MFLCAGEVTQTQLQTGLQKVKSRLDDYVLDCPSARTILDAMVAKGTSQGWLEQAP